MSSVLHPAAQQGFSLGAELYQQARPAYPEDLIDWLTHQLHISKKSKVIDLGAGTGKFLPYLKQVSDQVFAIEPIDELLAQLKLAHPDVYTIQTDSKNLTLPSNSIDAICCAQSFHWFANAESLYEIYHVLKPQAALGLIWNQRDTAVDWVQAIADLLTPLEQDTPRFHNGHWQKIFEQEKSLFQLKSLKKFHLEHQGSVEQVVVNRILSTSFISAASDAEKLYIRQQLLEIIQKYCNKTAEDEITFPYVTYAYHYEKKC
ncbi:methyltransferase domain-containing protein [Acinetobacter qingfengensis]|uniref:SAM-dependent methyltransferase n=1 Tax=Acinetobacter qingfengensis TaxID=1262585 RepID=A0A1E7R2Y3_9GAMM|nr:methyltransferase domain-containing protein [Acinetobacter qingfengensis]KAA8733832.1 methyltransferase domain-containing protein [Acinetobacter qingfengensis]OEY93655.1 SAM-dependent methyltransferase [Acinetobacter qingfengensis]